MLTRRFHAWSHLLFAGCGGEPGYTGGIERLVSNPQQVFIVEGKYFVYVYAGASRALVEAMKFRVWE